MRLCRCIPGLLLASTLLSCHTYPPHDPENNLQNMWAGPELNRASMHQAIVAQSTLFPYQFEEGSAALNPLGERDLDVLAEHLKTNPGPLRVRRGYVSEELYAKRLGSVAVGLESRGVDSTTIPLSDELGDGPRTWSETVRTRGQAKSGTSGAGASTTSDANSSGLADHAGVGTTMDQKDRQ
jgi:hypothetical protein